ncbi:N-acetylmuramoyl-L-alanine amidase [Streptomyces sp. WAC06614]|uniref:N-acetylmuramoyl-L-alanine amidase n=1 Tax=Streptomyces sp. WAC06614 TaxID=2487416 RepID=UPI00163C06FB|nr:N-acetylmuramoyl-L-alanine amidase [Streptomyces sp. WAC06614]
MTAAVVGVSGIGTVGVAQAAESEKSEPSSATLQQISLQANEGVSDLTGQRSTDAFRLFGLNWDDPTEQLSGDVEARTRDAQTGTWSDWVRLEANGPGGEENGKGSRGASNSVWVEPSDGVEVRVAGAQKSAGAALPKGARLTLVHPGTNGGKGTDDKVGTGRAGQPPIVSRAGWGADETMVPPGTEPGDPAHDPEYNPDVKAMFVHHTTESDTKYKCKESPDRARAVQKLHVLGNGWKDVGYNFMVDKCGTIFEGRKGGVDKPVLGAHTYGFNRESSGVALLGGYMDAKAARQALSAVGSLSAWKLGLHGVDPDGTVDLKAGATQKNHYGKQFEAGKTYPFERISAHRDGTDTLCSGDELYAQLPEIRRFAKEANGR